MYADRIRLEIHANQHDIYDLLDSQGCVDLFLRPGIGSEMTSHRCETKKTSLDHLFPPRKLT